MKSKISYLPFNLFWCLPTFFAAFFFTWTFDVWDHILNHFGISLLIYSIDVRASCAEDWLRDQISVLEAEQKKLQFRVKELEK